MLSKKDSSGNKIGLIDPSLEQVGKWDVNLGDLIISDSVRYILTELCGFEIYARVPSLKKLENEQFTALKKCDYVFVGGTNLLSSNMNEYRQWVIDLWDTFHLKNVILLGAGWWKYQSEPNLYTRILLKRVLNKNKYHSVRDSFTKKQLGSIGIHNVLNTSCPTLWGITPETQKSIPTHKATDVVFTTTCYNQKRDYDQQILKLLFENYRNVYFWEQGNSDKQYSDSLSSNLKYIPNSLAGFDQFLLEHDDIDYIGTRLHAGIRAIQKGKRALILGIDNRAIEINKDVNLNVVDRSDIAGVKQWIYSEYKTDIKLPLKSIEKWMKQFLA